jgi:peroxiredoxin
VKAHWLNTRSTTFWALPRILHLLPRQLNSHNFTVDFNSNQLAGQMPGSKAIIMTGMKMLKQITFSIVLSALCSMPALAKPLNYGDIAPDFPPGEFSDGKQYKLSDYAGKQLVVLFFYEQECPTCRRTIPERNKVVQQFEGKPVKFLAIGAGDSLEEVKAYAAQTHLHMPIFADKRSAMQKAYGIHISLGNIYQVRLINLEGKIIAYDMNPSTLNKALADMDAAKNRTNEEAASANNSTEGPANYSHGNTAEPAITPGNIPAENGDITPMQNIPGTNFKKTAPKGQAKPKVEWREIPEKDEEANDPNAARREKAANLNNDAVAAMRNGNNKLAVDKLKEAMDADPTYDMAKKSLQAAYTNYGIDLENAGKMDDAEDAMKKALDLADQVYSHDDERFKNAAENYAGLLTKNGKKIEAEAIRSTFLSPNK